MDAVGWGGVGGYCWPYRVALLVGQEIARSGKQMLPISQHYN